MKALPDPTMIDVEAREVRRLADAPINVIEWAILGPWYARALKGVALTIVAFAMLFGFMALIDLALIQTNPLYKAALGFCGLAVAAVYFSWMFSSDTLRRDRAGVFWLMHRLDRATLQAKRSSSDQRQR